MEKVVDGVTDIEVEEDGVDGVMVVKEFVVGIMIDMGDKGGTA